MEIPAMAALFKTEADYERMADFLLGQVNEDEHVYKTDEERREMVRQFRAAEAAGDAKTAEKLVGELFKEIELAIYKLANSLSSGGRSRRSGDENYGSVHNDAEELKQIGTIGFLKALSGGEITDKNGTRKTGFDPDGPGTFIGFMLKTVEGYMKNAHTREKNKFGLEKTSLDAPRGDSDDDKSANLYNSVFADSDLAFDAITSDSDYEEFLDSDAFGMLMDVLDDVAANDREKEVFKSYFGVDGYEKLTPTQIGEKFGFSKQRANQVVNKTLAKLKERLMRDRTGKTEYDESIEDEEELCESALDGMSLRQVERTIYQIWRRGGYDKEEHSDDQWWKPVHEFFGELIENDFNFASDSEYGDEDEDGNPTSRIWELEFKFKDREEKEQTFKARIIATGTAEGGDPLSSYKLSYEVI